MLKSATNGTKTTEMFIIHQSPSFHGLSLGVARDRTWPIRRFEQGDLFG